MGLRIRCGRQLCWSEKKEELVAMLYVRGGDGKGMRGSEHGEATIVRYSGRNMVVSDVETW